MDDNLSQRALDAQRAFGIECELRGGTATPNALTRMKENTRQAAQADLVVMGVRTEVLEFAMKMEAALRRHDDTNADGWKSAMPGRLRDLIRQHIDKAQIRDTPADWADVGNFAMMLAWLAARRK